ncbi:MAG: class I SAM-dependent methyltransferase, partial [Verrucomicrobia bacterium]|nr:class I SAM-dependent methyltransferase [Verrucomicrobiota bacterium]
MIHLSHEAAAQCSYLAQSRYYSHLYRNKPEPKPGESYFQDDTVDAWRHEWLIQNIDALLDAFPTSHWLTIGDGRFGRDARHIQLHNVDVLATDISGELLERARAQGYIHKCGTENAESLSFADKAFDFVLCKEAYHHCPRPTVALYEMIRVARQGIVLIEPQEAPRPESTGFIVKRLIKKLLAMLGAEGSFRTMDTAIVQCYENEFEKSGNYSYKISERECEKIAIGLNFSTIAFKGVNVCSDAMLDRHDVAGLRASIARRDRRVRRSLGRLTPDMLVACFLRGAPDADLVSGLAR